MIKPLYKHLPDGMKADKAVDNLEAFEAKYVPDLSEKVALVTGSKLYENKKTDRRVRYSEAIGLDFQAGEGVDCIGNLEDYRHCVFATKFKKFNHIDCISVLEHVERPWLAAETLEKILTKPLDRDGTILLSVPFVWRVHGYPSDYWRFTIEAVKSLFLNIEWKHICYMSGGLEFDKVPSVQTDKGVFFAKSEILGFGVKV